MRLIDADELMEHVWRDKLDCRGLIAEMVNNAPTVKVISTNIPISIFERLNSQEPCEDVISRTDVKRIVSFYKEQIDGIYRINESVDNLPSVTPKPKMGHWIKEKSSYGWDGKSYQCSECGRSIHLDLEVEDLSDYPYCHCGAKMTGSEE